MTNDELINGERPWRNLIDMAQVRTPSEGGYKRPPLLNDDQIARRRGKWSIEGRCGVKFYRSDNIHARWPDRNPNLPSNSPSSHPDFRLHGGQFDGVYGAMPKPMVVRSHNGHGIEADVLFKMINGADEKGVRFMPETLCSGSCASLSDLNCAFCRTGADDMCRDEELTWVVYTDTKACGAYGLGAFPEEYNEQGQCRYDMAVIGRDAHSVPGHRDAPAAGRTIAAVQDITPAHGSDCIETADGKHVNSNSRDTVSGNVRCTIAFRHPDDPLPSAMNEAVRKAADSETAAQVALDMIRSSPSIRFDARCVDAMETAIRTPGYSHRHMVPGAGHDGCQVTHKAPKAEVFMLCGDGPKHNEVEWAELII